MTIAKPIMADPFRCRMWANHERLERFITDSSCQAEIKSFTSHGQRIPVLGRRLESDASHDFELIYGARRLFVARRLNVPIEVEVRQLSDRDAAVALEMENRQRAEVSPYERGLCYINWLRAKCFDSQEELAAALNISASQVSRMMKLARLPSVSVNVVSSPLEIKESWGLDLHQGWQDPARQRALSGGARSIAKDSPRLSPERVYQRLVAQSTYAPKPRETSRDEVVKDQSGNALFRIRYQRRSISILLETQRLSSHDVDVLKHLIRGAIQDDPAVNGASRQPVPRSA